MVPRRLTRAYKEATNWAGMLSVGLFSAAALAGAPPDALPRQVAGFDSAYIGESAFLEIAPGETGEFTVFFTNTGTTPWAKGTSSQVDLAVCAADQVTCNIAAPSLEWSSDWLAATKLAPRIAEEAACL